MRDNKIENWKGNVSDGWWPVVEEIGKALLRLDPDFEIHQIKEKFGGLRFYYGLSQYDTEAALIAQNLVRFGENLCARTCETCGLPGSLRSDLGWVLTLCDRHYDAALERSGRNRTKST